ncbi:uncharacterized protein LOC134199661 isoform X1 [Bombyx mori]|uniref:uncharacterized protein LOC134199661 isoform X1 n=1 Tax=Bombyx mori TaxID=7091 RepID=UPI002ED59D3B
MNAAIFVLVVTLSFSKSTVLDFGNEFPDISEIFIMTENKRHIIDNIPNVFIRNTTVDLERLNVTNFWEKLYQYQDKLKEKLPNILEEFELPNPKHFNETRRQVLKWDWYHTPEFKEGSIIITRLKTLDLMLQLIYMARHKLKQMEGSKYFQRTDTGYRIAFLYRKLRKIFRKMMDIYTIMVKNKEKWTHQDWHLQLHTKATKLHVDFLYLWWVLVRVDEKYSIRMGFRPTVPSWMKLTKP